MSDIASELRKRIVNANLQNKKLKEENQKLAEESEKMKAEIDGYKKLIGDFFRAQANNYVRRVNEIVSRKDVALNLEEEVERLKRVISDKENYINHLEGEVAKYSAELQAGVLIEPTQIVTTTQVFYNYRTW